MSETSKRETDIPETIQSLLVAFAIALAFRGFVIEGFVIPTGSMAPTLMGEHVRFQTPDTGYEYAFDPTSLLRVVRQNPENKLPIYDPMISEDRAVGLMPGYRLLGNIRMGDRVLVLKYLYEFFEPDRWDVVVFKNPVDPIGPSQNYIKRLVGGGGEQVLLADGDVFTAPTDGGLDDFRIARRPRYIQEAVWQPVYDSNYVPLDAGAVETRIKRRFDGPPFKPSQATASNWTISGTRDWSFAAETRTRLDWAEDQIPFDDFNAYNVYRYPPLRGERRLSLRDVDPVSDLRLTAALVPDDATRFKTSLELMARGHRFVFGLDQGTAKVEMFDADGRSLREVSGSYEPGPGGLLDLEFAHIDQAMIIAVGGEDVARLEYEWNPMTRLENAIDSFDLDRYRANPTGAETRRPRLTWNFEGSPFEVRRVRVDRDLFYKAGRLDTRQQAAANGERIDGMLFATDPLEPAMLGPDQFLMLGDNSGASRDSRYWGRPHPLAATATGDDTPFIVHRDLLVGKAWCVYFPAPNRIEGTGYSVVPDIGRMRFIR
ncbi:MAG: S26 family signal peptidase [Phycisphaerales bacterium]|jgi:signal peptidase I|nr:S26 family signal peptidase [Phycisphaerales bacterium]